MDDRCRRRSLFVPLLGIVLYITTNHGTVKIELSDPKANAIVKVDGNTITVEGLGEPLRLRVGEHQLEVASDLFEAKGESLHDQARRERVIHVQMVPNAAASTAPAIRAAETGSDRTAKAATSEPHDKEKETEPSSRVARTSRARLEDRSACLHFCLRKKANRCKERPLRAATKSATIPQGKVEDPGWIGEFMVIRRKRQG